METEKTDVTTSEAEKEETYMDIVRSWGLLQWSGVIFGVVMIGWAASDYIKKPESQSAIPTSASEQKQSTRKGQAQSLEDWAKTLQGMKSDGVIALLGRPDAAEEKINDSVGVVQWTIFEYRDLVLNKFTGKTEKLSIAFMYGGNVRRVKEGYGKEIEVAP